MNSEDTLSSKALLLKEAGKGIAKAVVNCDWEEAQAAIDSYNTLKKELKMAIAAFDGQENRNHYVSSPITLQIESQKP